MFKGLTRLHILQVLTTSLGLIMTLLWPTETFIRAIVVLMWLFSLLLCLGTLESNKRIAQIVLATLFQNRVRIFAVLFLLLSVMLLGLILVISTTSYQLPPLVLYVPFIIFWPLLTIQLLKNLANDELPDARVFITRFQQVLASIVIFWICFEVLLQLGINYLPPQITMAMPQMPRRIGIRYDSELRLDLYPPGKVTYAMDGFSGDLNREVCQTRAKAEPRTTATYTRDHYGFRNTTPWPDSIDLAFAGDSFTSGEAVQTPMWDGLAPSILELGLPGSGQSEQAILIRSFALPRKPKVVVMAYYEGNDLADNWNYNQRLAINKSRYDNDPTISPWNYLVSYHLLLWIHDKLSSGTQNNCQNQIIDAHDNALVFGTFDSSALTLDKETLLNSEIFALTKNTIKTVAKEVQESGAQLVILFIPHKLHSHWNDITAVQMIERVSQTLFALEPDPVAGLKPDETVKTVDAIAERLIKNIDAQRDIIKETADEAGALFLDLTPAFQAAADSGKVLYFYSDVHLNQAGHDLARDVIREFLTQHQLLN